MGLSPANPVIIGSCPWTASVEGVQTVVRHGAGAVVLKSLFEEEMLLDRQALARQEEMFFWYPQAVEYLNSFSREKGLDDYVRFLREVKDAVDVPVIASINCATDREWPEFAAQIQDAGADGLELNIYIPPGSFQGSGKGASYPQEGGAQEGEAAEGSVEARHLSIVRKVADTVGIPVSAKIGFYVSDLTRFVPAMCESGLRGLVLFNRFYRPDIDIDALRVMSDNVLSAPEEITLSLRWIALLSQKTSCDLVGATGVHDYRGLAKQLLAGAQAVQVASTLLEHGPEVITQILDDFSEWMSTHRFESLTDVRGVVTRDQQVQSEFERVQYMKKSRAEYPGTQADIRG
jgi:dihydroorotate dehydrogenase (fumarate)